jgi:hypothetical protein
VVGPTLSSDAFALFCAVMLASCVCIAVTPGYEWSLYGIGVVDTAIGCGCACPPRRFLDFLDFLECLLLLLEYRRLLFFLCLVRRSVLFLSLPPMIFNRVLNLASVLFGGTLATACGGGGNSSAVLAGFVEDVVLDILYMLCRYLFLERLVERFAVKTV